MKKVLVLALVLSMATMANAGLVLSVDIDNWTFNGGTLSISTDADIVPGTGEGYWAIGAQTSQATISGGVSLITEESGIVIFDDAVGAAGIQLPAGENGVFGGISLATISLVAAGTTIYDGITLTYEGWISTVSLYQVNGDTGEIMSTYSVAYLMIPEPMTLGLFGLGGLFLRRRK